MTPKETELMLKAITIMALCVPIVIILPFILEAIWLPVWWWIVNKFYPIILVPVLTPIIKFFSYIGDKQDKWRKKWKIHDD